MLVDVVMPQMGTSMSEGTVVAWSKQVGDHIEADEPLCEIDTDKIDTDCPAPATGTLQEILVNEGETVEVGTVLARIATAGAANAAGSANTDRAGSVGEAVLAAPSARALHPSTGPARRAAPTQPNAGRHYSPVVTRIAAEHGVDLSEVPGTGRGGRVTKKDVLAWIEARGNGGAPAEERPLHSESPYRSDPSPATPDDLGGVPEPLSRMRQSIGAAMRGSLATAATCTTVVECDMLYVEQRRRELGITALPLIARATIDTLREFPELNATLDGTTLTRYERVHLGIAVSLGADGLIVPVVHDAQELAPEGLAARIKELARRARAKQLTPDDVHGATFTITNPGQYGALIATPVIPLPQVAILDLEAIVKRPVVVDDGNGGDAIAIRPLANLCMSWDHRALDGAYAAQFLTALRHRLERP
jgi:pyruvate/2-oxoglutarate dehydrogenase complex dihydrolipoamide acyltransferase (E2) component